MTQNDLYSNAPGTNGTPPPAAGPMPAPPENGAPNQAPQAYGMPPPAGQPQPYPPYGPPSSYGAPPVYAPPAPITLPMGEAPQFGAPNNILECSALFKRYGSSVALDGIDLTLPRGRIIGLLGPNGSGKTTLIKLACGLLTPTNGSITIEGSAPGIATKARVSYLPERDYLPNWMKASDLLDYFADFYTDFDRNRALDMLARLQIEPSMRLKAMSKGTREKVQLILVMSRNAALYLLDEPIGGVDPAARDYILETIISNYRPDATVIISTHLISDIERVLDHVVFLNMGRIAMVSSVDDIRQQYGKSVDQLFREVYRC